MAVKLIASIQTYVGASTDTKPTGAPVGSRFLEYDTDAQFVTYDGTNWAAISTIASVTGTVAIDQTTDGTTNAVNVKTTSGAGATIGTTTDAAVITDANGTISGKLRGLIALVLAKIGITIASGDVKSGAVASGAIASGAVASGAVASGAIASGAIVDGANVVEGTTTDAAVVTDANGTLSSKLRGLVKWAFERMPAALGQGTMAQSLPVVLPSNQSSVPVTPAATESHLGEVGGKATTVTVTPVLTVAGAYSANDFVGTSATALIFANAVRVSGGTGTIQSAVLVDAALQSLPLELWLFSTAVTPPADNAAFSISDADAATCIGVIPFSTYYASALNSVSVQSGLGIAFKAVATTIWGALVTRGTPTYTSLDLTVRLSIYQD